MEEMTQQLQHGVRANSARLDDHGKKIEEMEINLGCTMDKCCELTN
jgi:hypothetical protein